MPDFDQDPRARTEYEIYCLDQSVTNLVSVAADPDKRHLVSDELHNIVETAAKLNGLVAYLRAQSDRVAA